MIRRRIRRPERVEEKKLVIEGDEARRLSKLKITVLETCAFDAPEFRTVRINSMRRNFKLFTRVQTSKVSVELNKSEITKFRGVKIEEVSVQLPLRSSDIAKFRNVQISPVRLKNRKKVKGDRSKF